MPSKRGIKRGPTAQNLWLSQFALLAGAGTRADADRAERAAAAPALRARRAVRLPGPLLARSYYSVCRYSSSTLTMLAVRFWWYQCISEYSGHFTILVYLSNFEGVADSF